MTTSPVTRAFFDAASTAPSSLRSILLHRGRVSLLRDRTLVCDECDLGSTANRVPAEVPERPQIVFVGEAPGAEEDRTSTPFVGPSGRLLEELAHDHLHLSRSQYAVVNTICCRPARNDFALAVQADAPTRCRPLLYSALELSGSWLCVTLGRRAYDALRHWATDGRKPAGTLGAARSQPFWTSIGLAVYSTYHPSYALRNPSAKTDIANDFTYIRSVLDGTAVNHPEPPPYPPPGLTTRSMTSKESDEWTRFLKRRGWAVINSRILEQQLVVTVDNRPPPSHVAHLPHWTLAELWRLARHTRLGEHTYSDIRRIAELKHALSGEVTS